MKKSSGLQIVFEFISIVFAVLLALGLNSFKQSQDLKQESRILRNKILKEVRFNLSEIDSAIFDNESYFSYLDSIVQLDEIKAFKVNYANAQLTSSSWEFTQVSNAFTHLDHDFLEEAAQVYELQEYYMLISNQMFQNIGLMLMQDTESKIIVNTSSYYLSNINKTSYSLRKSYQDLLENHEPKK